MSLCARAGQVGVSKYTACRWHRARILPVPARRARRLILVDPDWSAACDGRTVIYARVSPAGQQAGLDRQVVRLASWATANGLAVGEVAAEVGSAMKGRRGELGWLLGDAAAVRIVAGHRDRLGRFGVGDLQAALAARGREIVILDPGELDDDLVRDMAGVLTSFCARPYGRRGARNRAMRALDCAQSPAADAAGEAGA